MEAGVSVAAAAAAVVGVDAPLLGLDDGAEGVGDADDGDDEEGGATEAAAALNAALVLRDRLRRVASGPPLPTRSRDAVRGVAAGRLVLVLVLASGEVGEDEETETDGGVVESDDGDDDEATEAAGDEAEDVRLGEVSDGVNPYESRKARVVRIWNGVSD